MYISENKIKEVILNNKQELLLYLNNDIPHNVILKINSDFHPISDFKTDIVFN